MPTRSRLLARFCCCFATLLATLLTAACSQSNNLFTGKVEATVGSHRVVVEDCYRLSVDPPQTTNDGYRYTPCRDADVQIRGEEVLVNGRSYGQINPSDSILVDHGAVSIGGPKTGGPKKP